MLLRPQSLFTPRGRVAVGPYLRREIALVPDYQRGKADGEKCGLLIPFVLEIKTFGNVAFWFV